MKLWGWIIVGIILAACGGSKKSPVPQTNAYAQDGFEVARLDTKRVKELLVVIFERDFSPQEWKVIFDQTKTLSQNKRDLRAIEGRLDAEAEEIRGNKIAENAELLTELGMKSLFLMSWSVGDENCRFDTHAGSGGSLVTRMTCKPKNRDNPLNGGLPVPVGDVQWSNPNPVVSDTKTPYLSIGLKLESAYELELRLKPESIEPSEYWFKGEAVPTAQSQFIDFEGRNRPATFRYGYAEMMVGP
jgi:hypothetical protein